LFCGSLKTSRYTAWAELRASERYSERYTYLYKPLGFHMVRTLNICISFSAGIQIMENCTASVWFRVDKHGGGFGEHALNDCGEVL
jgi:hypothetical protein